MAIADRRRAKVEAFVAPSLEPGEQITATLSFGQTGPSPWFSALTYLMFLLVHMKAVVVTDRRVILVAKSFWTGRPRAIDEVGSRAEVRLLEYRKPVVWGKLVLQLAATTLKLNIPRIHATEADTVVAALGGVPSSSAQ